MRVLESEAHNLRRWECDAFPAFFAQQLRNGAGENGAGALAAWEPTFAQDAPAQYQGHEEIVATYRGSLDRLMNALPDNVTDPTNVAGVRWLHPDGDMTVEWLRSVNPTCPGNRHACTQSESPPNDGNGSYVSNNPTGPAATCWRGSPAAAVARRLRNCWLRASTTCTWMVAPCSVGRPIS